MNARKLIRSVSIFLLTALLLTGCSFYRLGHEPFVVTISSMKNQSEAVEEWHEENHRSKGHWALQSSGGIDGLYVLVSLGKKTSPGYDIRLLNVKETDDEELVLNMAVTEPSDQQHEKSTEAYYPHTLVFIQPSGAINRWISRLRTEQVHIRKHTDLSDGSHD